MYVLEPSQRPSWQENLYTTLVMASLGALGAVLFRITRELMRLGLQNILRSMVVSLLVGVTPLLMILLWASHSSRYLSWKKF